MASLRDVMQLDLATVGPAATVGEAAEVMSIRRVGSVLVLDPHGDLRGIFTERDIVRALAFEHDAASHPVAQWMTSEPMTMEPDANDDDALRIMLDRGFRHLPVLDDGRVVGMVSIRDLAHLIERES
jgi:CBS domain-containing protein